MYGPILGASTTTVAALALPNTGSNSFLESVVITALVAGVVITIISIARIASARSN